MVGRRVYVFSSNQISKMFENCCLKLCSVVIVFGEPNRDIQWVQNAVAIVSAVIFERGTASGHRVNLSIIVRHYRQFCCNGITTMSRWTWSSLPFGTSIFSGERWLCLWILERWQARQTLHHSRTFLFIEGHTNFWGTWRAVDRPLGWDKPRTNENTALRKDLGT